jgi:acetyl-CoA carboxylase biotin carboxyl carrier protein
MTEILNRVVSLVAEHGLAELTVEEDGLVVSVKGIPEAPPAPTVVSMQAPAHLIPVAQAPAYSETIVTTPTPPAARAGSRVALESPMVGVFYRSPSPEDPPFVNVGDVIRIGQTVGLIEAMKVYSELPSEVAGRIVEIAVDNGKLVKQGQPLFFVEPV